MTYKMCFRRNNSRREEPGERTKNGRLICIVLVVLLALNLLLGLLGLIFTGGMAYLRTSDVGDFIAREKQRSSMIMLTHKIFNGLLGCGAALLMITLIGDFLVASRMKFVALVYVILMVCFIFVEIIPFFILVSNSTIHGSDVREMLYEMLVNEYRGSNPDDGTHKNVYSFIVDALHVKLQCCGINNFTDFSATDGEWHKNVLYKLGFVFKIPVSCCRFNIENDDFENMKVKKPNCIFEPSRENSWIEHGCYHKLVKFIEGNSWIFILAFWILIIIQIICCILAAFFWVRSRRKKQPSESQRTIDDGQEGSNSTELEENLLEKTEPPSIEPSAPGMNTLPVDDTKKPEPDSSAQNVYMA